MIKKILIAFVLIVVIAAVALFFTVNSLIGGGVTKAFNKFGPEITGTKTYIESTSVNVFDGNVGINGLFVGNPKGFEKPSAMETGEIYIDVDPGSLFSDTIVVNEIRILSPKFTYDQNLATNNLTTLQKQIDENMKKFKGTDDKPAEKPEEAPTEEQPKKTIILHKLVVKEAEVDLAINLAVVKTGRAITLPEINKDFGGEGVTPAEAADYVLSVVLEKVAEEAAKLVREISNDPNAVLESVTGGSGSQALEEAGDAVEKAGEKIKGLFD